MKRKNGVEALSAVMNFFALPRGWLANFCALALEKSLFFQRGAFS